MVFEENDKLYFTDKVSSPLSGKEILIRGIYKERNEVHVLIDNSYPEVWDLNHTLFGINDGYYETESMRNRRIIRLRKLKISN